MILGEDTRECMECREMKPYDNFDYDGGDDYHVNDDCKECYGSKKNTPKVGYQVKPVIENKETHAPSCPICYSNTKCGCYDIDSDGYGRAL